MLISKIRGLNHKIDILKYQIFNKFKKKSGLNNGIHKKKIIISLTTYPKRFSVVYLTIESLLNQTLKPDKIILWLSKEDLKDRNIPFEILKLKDRGVTINLVDENLKSYKKLIYSLEDFFDYKIVTCDDDVIYPQYFIAKLYAKYQEYPSSVIAYRCSFIQKNAEKHLAPYISWKALTCSAPSYNLFPTGVGGILYPPNILNKKVFDKKLFLRLSPSGDDIWFKAMALLNNRKTVMVYEKSIEFPVIKGSQDEALWHLNVTMNKNDEQLKNVFDYFDLYKYIE